jgi:hypothetical protein
MIYQNLALQIVIIQISDIGVFPTLFPHRNAITTYGFNLPYSAFRFVVEGY